MHIKNKETGEEFDATDILPEYFYISVPLFNNRLEREIDDWLHVMKYDEVPANYHSPYMKQVAEKLGILKMSSAERADYSHYRKEIYNDRDELQAAEARGEAKGEEKAKITLAKKMLAKGKTVEEIIEFTDLTVEQINQLK